MRGIGRRKEWEDQEDAEPPPGHPPTTHYLLFHHLPGRKMVQNREAENGETSPSGISPVDRCGRESQGWLSHRVTGMSQKLFSGCYRTAYANLLGPSLLPQSKHPKPKGLAGTQEIMCVTILRSWRQASCSKPKEPQLLSLFFPPLSTSSGLLPPTQVYISP